MIPQFISHEQSHQHSLRTLETLYEYDDFMESVKDMVDLGSGSGLDLEWWATRTTREEVPQPLNIRCLGIDLEARSMLTTKYTNIQPICSFNIRTIIENISSRTKIIRTTH